MRNSVLEKSIRTGFYSLVFLIFVIIVALLFESDGYTTEELIEKLIEIREQTKSIKVIKPQTCFDMEATGYAFYRDGNKQTRTGIVPFYKEELAHGTVAVDPKYIPLGAILWVRGYGKAIAADTGSAIKGNTIDLFFNSRRDARSWGRQITEVCILELPAVDSNPKFPRLKYNK